MTLDRRNAYRDKRWLGMRAHQLKIEKWCRYCAAIGQQTRATFVDHVIPHRGREDLFWDAKNLQSLCTICHNAAKQREETLGDQIGCGPDGWPRGADHDWNTGRFVRPTKS